MHISHGLATVATLKSNVDKALVSLRFQLLNALAQGHNFLDESFEIELLLHREIGGEVSRIIVELVREMQQRVGPESALGTYGRRLRFTSARRALACAEPFLRRATARADHALAAPIGNAADSSVTSTPAAVTRSTSNSRATPTGVVAHDSN